MENGLISVIIPVYNAEQYLEECIQSVICQDYENWELILIDDGSLDNSYKICLKYADLDKRICVLHNDNHGVSYTRNCGIRASKGEYICFVDSDDFVLPDYLGRLFNFLTKNDADVAFCGYQLLYGDRYVRKRSRIVPGVYCFEDLSSRMIDDGSLSGILFGSTCWAMYRCALLKEQGIFFNSDVRRNEDGLFNLQLLPNAKKIVVSDYEGYVYRQYKTISESSNVLSISDELNAVSTIIREKCGIYENVEKQLRCRELSIIFWNMQKVSCVDAPSIKVAKQLKEYIIGAGFHQLYCELDFPALNKYKRVLVELIYRKQYLLFVVLVKYIKPVLERWLPH